MAPTGPLTVEMWVASETPPVSKLERRHLASIGIEHGLINLDLRYNFKQVAQTSLIADVQGQTNLWTTGTIRAGEYAGHGWMHIAYIWTGHKMHIYLNGKRREDNQRSGGDEGKRLADTVLATLGGKSSLGQPFQGRIRELRISKSIRYQKDFTVTLPDVPFATDADTLALYHFDKGLAGNQQSGPFLFGNDLKMAYASRSQGKQHIWIASRKSLDQPFETREDTGVIGSWPTLTSDGLIMVFRSEGFPRHLLKVERSSFKEKFSQPKEISVNGTEPYLFPDGLTLVYGYNDKNMQYVTRTSRKESFGKPTQIGSPFIKGTFNGAPFVTADQKTIYFVSRRPGSVGDADLYRSTLVPK